MSERLSELEGQDSHGSLRACVSDPKLVGTPDKKGKEALRAKLIQRRRALPGLRDGADPLVSEIARSVATERWMRAISSGRSDAADWSPAKPGWDPLRAIVHFRNAGAREEATWLAFLTIHLGPREGPDGWASIRALYSGFGDGNLTWEVICERPSAIEHLRRTHPHEFELLRFGNHRKYQSRDRLPDVVASYVDGVRQLAGGSQIAFFMGHCDNGRPSFHKLMEALAFVREFGRLARYDFLCLLGNLAVYDLVPDRLYLDGATGPLRGAGLLFGLDDPAELDRRACSLARDLGVSLQAMEDALCNWQKHR